MADYVFPVKGYTGAVNLHWGSFPGGSDLFAPKGTPVLAIHSGVVVEAGYSEIGGNNVLIHGDDGLFSYYAHGSAAPSVKDGQRVTAGQFLMPLGNTGNASGMDPHLHFGMGRDIINGSGPTGGCGSDFDAVGLLRRLLGQAPAQPPKPVYKRFKTTVADLRLREVPGLESKVLAELPAGTVLTATVSESYAWRRVRAPDGKVGWVAEMYLEEVT